MAQISIIIPCYNVEQYVERCMESVVSQTIGIENLEVILIDDASTDGTRKKLEEWEKRFPENILVIACEHNLKQGGARNVGLQYASSDYIGFLDSDDWIEPDMYETLYLKALEGNFDVVRGKFVREGHPGIVPKAPVAQRDCEYHFTPIRGICMGEYPDVGDNGEFGSICTGIYRRSMVSEHEIFFPENLAYEDNYWADIAALYTKDCYIVDKVFYHYMTNPGSTVTGSNSAHHLDRLKIELMKLEKYQSLGVLDIDEFKEQIEWKFIQMYYLNTMFILFTRFSVIPADTVNSMISTVNKRFPHWQENPYTANVDMLNALLLELLKLDRSLSTEEITEIGTLYLNAWKECHGI